MFKEALALARKNSFPMEGFEIFFGHKTTYYQDNRGKFSFGFEDGFLSATPHQDSGQAVALSQSEIDQIVERIVRGLTWEGLSVQVVPNRSRADIDEGS
jgi:hypothetical protein